jgi:hypothetical protein
MVHPALSGYIWSNNQLDIGNSQSGDQLDSLLDNQLDIRNIRSGDRLDSLSDNQLAIKDSRSVDRPTKHSTMCLMNGCRFNFIRRLTDATTQIFSDMFQPLMVL